MQFQEHDCVEVVYPLSSRQRGIGRVVHVGDQSYVVRVHVGDAEGQTLTVPGLALNLISRPGLDAGPTCSSCSKPFPHLVEVQTGHADIKEVCLLCLASVLLALRAAGRPYAISNYATKSGVRTPSQSGVRTPSPCWVKWGVFPAGALLDDPDPKEIFSLGFAAPYIGPSGYVKAPRVRRTKRHVLISQQFGWA